MQAWLFYYERTFWTNERVKAFLSKIPIVNFSDFKIQISKPRINLVFFKGAINIARFIF